MQSRNNIKVAIFIFIGRMPPSGKLPVLKNTKKAKNQHFRLAGATRCTD